MKWRAHKVGFKSWPDNNGGENMVKKVNLILVLLIGLFCQISFASDAPKRLSVCLIYKVANTVLQCQNKEEDMVAGQKEFEETLMKNYSKRFDVKKIQRMDENDIRPPKEYLDMATPPEVPLVVWVKLEGTGVSVDHYQNAFGAKVDGVAPSTFVHIKEVTVDRKNYDVYGWDYGTQEYTAGTFSLGRVVAAADTDPRRNAKNAIKAALKDACSQNEKINKYVDPEAYEIDQNRFHGYFKKANEIQKQQKDAIIAKEAPLRARVDKFVDYIHNHPELGVTNLVDANRNDLSTLKQMMEMYIKMGLYKEQ